MIKFGSRNYSTFQNLNILKNTFFGTKHIRYPNKNNCDIAIVGIKSCNPSQSTISVTNQMMDQLTEQSIDTLRNISNGRFGTTFDKSKVVDVGDIYSKNNNIYDDIIEYHKYLSNENINSLTVGNVGVNTKILDIILKTYKNRLGMPLNFIQFEPNIINYNFQQRSKDLLINPKGSFLIGYNEEQIKENPNIYNYCGYNSFSDKFMRENDTNKITSIIQQINGSNNAPFFINININLLQIFSDEVLNDLQMLDDEDLHYLWMFNENLGGSHYYKLMNILDGLQNINLVGACISGYSPEKDICCLMGYKIVTIMNKLLNMMSNNNKYNQNNYMKKYVHKKYELHKINKKNNKKDNKKYECEVCP